MFVLQIAQGRKVRLREKCLLVQGALTKQYVHQAPPGRQIRVSRDCCSCLCSSTECANYSHYLVASQHVHVRVIWST